MTSALMPNYGTPELEFDHGQGSYLYSSDGTRYLDFAMGIAVNSLGHCHPRLIAALTKQANKLWHTSNLYRISEAERLASTLAAKTFADRVFFCNSGTEAVECGFKLIRRFNHAQDRHQRKRIIGMTNAFHGRTHAALAAAANPSHSAGFLVGDNGFDQAVFGDLESLKALISAETAGVILEPIQGEGGIRVVDRDYLKAVKELCAQHDLLLMFDEVQCGVGRTGTLYAYQQLGVTPDILASAKGLGGGFPIGACLATEVVAATMTAGSHGSTFGGNPLAMAVANAVLAELTTPGFLPQVQQRSAYFRAGLQTLVDQHPALLKGISGLGLMIGLQCEIPAAELITRLQQEAMLVVKAGGNSIRILPPLNVSEEELDEALTIIAKILINWKLKI